VRLATDVEASPLSHPLVLLPTALIQHVQERPPFDFIGFVKSPMVLMGLLTLVMVAVMPKIMKDLGAQRNASFTYTAQKRRSNGKRPRSRKPPSTRAWHW
jgi:hypothetical protein